MKKQFVLSLLAIAALLIVTTGCNMPVTKPTATQSPVIVPSDTPAVQGIPPTIAVPTPVLSEPAIQHFTSGQAISIAYIRMVDTARGWAIGGLSGATDHVFRTQDAGQTWSDVTPPQQTPAAGDSVTALGFFKDASSGWVVYGPGGAGGTIPPFVFVWRTHDSGVTWQYGTVDTSGGSFEFFLPSYLTFVGDQNGWFMVAVGAGMMHQYVAIFSTSDGGATWTKILDPFVDTSIQSFPKTDLVFADAQNGWLTRDAQGVENIPHVFRTVDGGVTWNQIDLPAPSDKTDLFDKYSCGTYTPNVFLPTSVIVALKCLDNATYQTQLDFQYGTTDGGTTWQIHPLPAGYSISAVNDGLLYFDLNHAFALGHSIFQTNDGGLTWTLIKQVNWDGQFSFANMNMGWAVARSDSDIAFVSTTTGCAKWAIINPYIVP
jgi:photosystem II stability/assembly factor-like uncharacterized protein